PDLFLVQPYAARCPVLRTSLVRALGGWRGCCEGAHDHDLVLRAAARTTHIHHIPDVLSHRRVPAPTDHGFGAAGDTFAAVKQALADHLRETGRDGCVEPADSPGGYRVRFRLAGSPRVSIIIPTAFAGTGQSM